MAPATRPRILVLAALTGVAACTGPAAPPSQPASTATVGPSATATTTTMAPGPSTTVRPAPPSSVWVANELGRSLSQVDVVAGRVLAGFDTPGRPHNITAGEGGLVAATLPGEGLLQLVGPGSGRVVALGGEPHDVKAVGSRLVVANEGSATVHVLESDGRRVSDIRLPAQPHDLAVSPDGRTAWVSLDGSDRLAEVDLESAAVRRLVPTGASPHDLLFSPAGELWVTDWTGPVSVYSAEGMLQARVDLGPQSHHLAFTADGREGWITDNSVGQVFVVDVGRRTVVATLRTPGPPHHIAIVGGLAAVAVATGATVVYDVVSRTETARVPTGSGPHGVAAAR